MRKLLDAIMHASPDDLMNGALGILIGVVWFFPFFYAGHKNKAAMVYIFALCIPVVTWPIAMYWAIKGRTLDVWWAERALKRQREQEMVARTRQIAG